MSGSRARAAIGCTTRRAFRRATTSGSQRSCAGSAIAGWRSGPCLALIALWLVLQRQPFVLLIGLSSILFAWFTYGRPFVRGRYRKALATLPRWDLKAEPGEGSG